MRTLHQQGGYAFPRGPIGEDCGKPYGQTDGMTLRDWFAGQAILAAVVQSAHDDAPVEQNARAAAAWAYAVADAMLAERGC